MSAAEVAAERATFRDVFANSEFRALWLAQLLSVAGDQLARVAMTVLVYDRTHSALWTAATYAATFLPWILGSVTLSGLADRLPRRQLMVACDAARLMLVSLMALVSLVVASGAALWIMVALLFVVTLLDSPFKSARSALVPDILTGDHYVLGTAVTQTTFQVGTVVGFALGGVAVSLLGVRSALMVDAATFGASAVLLWSQVAPRPAAAPAVLVQERSQSAGMAAGMRLVFGQRILRTLVLFGWLVAFYEVPLSLAVPYAARFHHLALPVAAGLIFASAPFGNILGLVVVGRLVTPARRRIWMGPLAVLACGLLALCWFRPGLIASMCIFVIAGACAAYQLPANASFVAAVPPERRGQAFGLANGGMQVSQGLWFVAAGAAALAVAPAVVIAVSGSLGAVVAAGLAKTWQEQARFHGSES